MTSRRSFFVNTLVAAVSSGALLRADESTQNSKEAASVPNMFGNEAIGILIYPGFTALDVFGPHHFLSLVIGASVHLVAENEDAVTSDAGVRIFPTKTFSNCPEKLTVLLIPGGTTGTLAAAENPAVREFLRSRGEKADWICSVCTGSLILAAGGLLNGYEATSHWLVRDQLSLFGAKPVDRRVVVDRNRITGAGVTAGLDFGLSLVKQLRGQSYAEGVQLMSEYDPQPPLNAGSSRSAPEEMTKLLRNSHAAFNRSVDDLAKRIAVYK